MEKLKPTFRLQQLADEFDVYDLIDEIEEDILAEEDKGMGHWQDYVYVLANVPIVKEIIKGIKPIIKGRCWLVVDAEDVSLDMNLALEDTDFYLIDYITRDDFRNNGVDL